MESILPTVRGAGVRNVNNTSPKTDDRFHMDGKLESHIRDSEEYSDAVPTEVFTDYEHDLIDRTSRSIRLLSLSHQAGGEIFGDLSTVNMSECPKYVALSYTWEPRFPKHNLHLNGGQLEIGKNLYDALCAIIRMRRSSTDDGGSSGTHHIQQPREDNSEQAEKLEAQTTTEQTLEQCSFFWIDAICINQTSDIDRSHQVGLMKQIYTEAACVLLWLGEESGESNIALSLLQDMASGKVKKLDRNEAKQLKELFSRPYWKRIWIVQECVLAQATVIACGSKRIVWRDIFSSSSPAPKLIRAEPSISLPRVVNLWQSHHEWNSLLPVSLEYLIDTFKNHKCEDPRDKVFGLLSLVHNIDRGQEMFTMAADYTMTTEEVCSHILYGLRDHGRMSTQRIAPYSTRRTETGMTLWEFEDVLRSALRLPSLRSFSWVAWIFGTEQYKPAQPWVFPG